MAFDILGARDAGYSDDEIAEYLAKERGFNFKGALESGYSPQEVLDHLTQQPKSRSWGEAVSDTAMSFGRGAGGLIEGAGTLYGLATGDMDNAAREIGQSASEFYQHRKSDELKAREAARSEKIKQADGFLSEAGTAIKETVTDPALLGSFLTEQIPQFVGPGVVGRVAGLAGKAAATGGAVGAGSALQGADVASDVYEEAKRAALAQGMTADQAEAEALSVARQAGAAGAAISVGSQFLPGGRTIERVLAGADDRVLGRVAGAARGAIGEGASEFVEEAGGKIGANVAIQNLDPERRLLEGAGEAGGLGLLGGVGMGGATGALERSRQSPVVPPAEVLAAQSVDEAIRAAEAELDTSWTPLPSEAELAIERGQATEAKAHSIDFAPTPVEEAVNPAPGAGLEAETFPESTPAAARAYDEFQPDNSVPYAPRPVEGLGMAELVLAAKLTRSAERRAELSAEIERRGTEAQETPAAQPEVAAIPQQPTQESLPQEAVDAPAVEVSQSADGGASAAQAYFSEGIVEPATQEEAPAISGVQAQGVVDGSSVQTPVAEIPAAAVDGQPVSTAPAVNEPSAPVPVASEAQPTPSYRDYTAPKTIGTGRSAIVKGSIRTFKTERVASTFAKQQKLSGWSPRETEDGWVLSKPVREQTQAQRAAAREQAKRVRVDDDVATMLRKMGGVRIDSLDGADPKDIQSANKAGFGPVFRNEGMTMDGVAEALAEQGFDVLDEAGRPDATKASEIIHQVLSGERVYSPEGMTLRAERQARPEELAEAGLVESDREDLDAMVRLGRDRESLIERLAIQFGDDEAGFSAALKEHLDDPTLETLIRGQADPETSSGAEEGLDRETALERYRSIVQEIRESGPEKTGELTVKLDTARVAAERAGASTREIMQSMEAPRRPVGPEKLAAMLDRQTPADAGVSASSEQTADAETGNQPEIAIGEFVRFRVPHATEGTTARAGMVKRLLGDGRYEIKGQDGGYYTLSRGEFRTRAEPLLTKKTEQSSGKSESESDAQTPELRLTGETEPEIRSREENERSQAESKRRRDAAPDPSGFTLTGSDRQVDEAEARGQKPMFSRKSEPKTLADFWFDYAQDPDAFQYPKSDEKDATKLAQAYEMGDGWKVSETTRSYLVPGTNDRDSHKLIYMEARKADGTFAPYLEMKPDQASPEDTVFIRINDSGQWPRNLGGSKAYQVAMAWAINNGFRLNPDADLLPVNRLRRTEAMISTYLKYGEKAAVIAPHREQYVGLVSDFDWRDLTEGGKMDRSSSGMPHEDEFNARLDSIKNRLWKPVPATASAAEKTAIFRSNLENLVIASASLAERRLPALKDVRVVNDDGELESAATGKRLGVWGPGVVGHLGLPALAHKIGIGDTTARRAIATLTALGGDLQKGRILGRGRAGGGQRLPGAEERVGVLETGGDRGLVLDPAKAKRAASVLGKKSLYAKAPERGLRTSGLTNKALRSELDKTFGEKVADRLLDRVIVPLETQGEIPAHVAKFVREGDTVMGFYDPKTDKTYAILENLKPEDVRGLVMHEVGVHYGFERMLGGDRYRQVLRQLDLMHASGNKKVMAAREVAEKQSADSSQVKEETLAYLVQNEPELSIVQRVVAAIKAFMFKEFGIGLGRLTTDDLGALARAAVMHASKDPVVSAQMKPAFSRPDAKVGAHPASWDATEPSKMENALRTLQDRHIDTKAVLKAIRDTGKSIREQWDVYMQEELYHGRTAHRVEEFNDRELKPLLREMAARNVEILDFEKYLHARHAEEANKVVAERNPDMKDGGSGMETAEAQKYLKGLSERDLRAYEALAARVDKIVAGTRNMLVDYGLENAETVKGWADQFKHYVPLNREDMGNGPGTGQGFSVKGPASKSRTGSKRKVVDILANIAMQREKAVVRGEKNRVANALVGLAMMNPNEDFWKVDRPPKIRALDDAGQVKEYTDPLYKSRDNVVVARHIAPSGKVSEHAVIFNESNERAMRMAEALKNLDTGELEGFYAGIGKITRFLASVNTQYNPIFGVTNIVRDVQGSLVNLSSTPLKGKQAEVASHILPALRGVYIDLRNRRDGQESDSTWAKLYEQFRGAGGQTGYRDMFATSADRAKALEDEIKKGGKEGIPRKAWRATFDWLSDYNLAMENAVRLSVYKVGIDNGLSDEKAASIAKNISVNFNRKGSATTQIGSLYAFFNASVQGTARLAETLKGPAGAKVITGGVLLGVLQAAALAAAGFDEDEPPDFEREKNLIIPIGGKKYIKIAMPLGLHVLPNLGRVGAEFVMSGFKKPGKRLTDLMATVLDAFNPMGSSHSALQTAAPTVFDPFVALAENRDWSGRQIAKKDRSDLEPTPGHTRAKDSASSLSIALSRAINAASGGTKHKPGTFSPTPDQIDYLVGQATGGVGREALKTMQTGRSAVTGEDLPPHKIPLVGRFYGDAATPSAQANTFYKNIKELNEHEAEIKGRRKARESVSEYLKENPDARLVPYGNSIERQVAMLRRRKSELVQQGADQARVKEMEDRINGIMTRFNERIKRRQEQPSAQ